eukprot:GEZU01034158.1.p2 GENE.GEZU01034158.1~~GEZU01034158.1.p2  ORF type:complete len:123 (+),score=46.95 GEZU01034158.1:66-434(+)
MIPPKHLYRVTIKNNLDSVGITATVTYEKDDHTTTTETHDIPPHGSHLFDQKTYTKDSAEFTYFINRIQVRKQGADAVISQLSVPFEGVKSPVKHKTLSVGAGTAAATSGGNDNGLELKWED